MIERYECHFDGVSRNYSTQWLTILEFWSEFSHKTKHPWRLRGPGFYSTISHEMFFMNNWYDLPFKGEHFTKLQTAFSLRIRPSELEPKERIKFERYNDHKFLEIR